MYFFNLEKTFRLDPIVFEKIAKKKQQKNIFSTHDFLHSGHKAMILVSMESFGQVLSRRPHLIWTDSLLG
jgi:ATP sulfurylase